MNNMIKTGHPHSDPPAGRAGGASQVAEMTPCRTGEPTCRAGRHTRTCTLRPPRGRRRPRVLAEQGMPRLRTVHRGRPTNDLPAVR